MVLTSMMLLTATAGAYTKIIPGDYNANDTLDASDFVMWDNVAASSSEGPVFFQPGCSVSGWACGNENDKGYMYVMLIYSWIHATGTDFVDLSYLDCSDDCEAGQDGYVTISGSVYSLYNVDTPSVDGPPGVSCEYNIISYFPSKGPLAVKVEIENDTTGGAYTSGSTADLDDVDTDTGECEVSLTASCGEEEGSFDVVISIDNNSWQDNSPGSDEITFNVCCDDEGCD